MLRVIDRTLTALTMENKDYSSEKLTKLCNLIASLGVDYIEISVPLLEKIRTLPEAGHYILKIDKENQRQLYPDFEMYTTDFTADNKMYEDTLYEVYAKNMEELMAKKDIISNRQIRITGLDSMICEDNQEKYSQFIGEIRKKIDFCPGDANYCATALALQWLMEGGRNISVSFNGAGGYAKLEEVLLGAKVILHKKIKQRIIILQEIAKAYEDLTGKHIYYNKAVVGKNIFNIEAGIQFEKNTPVSYEPYKPEEVGKVRKIVIGKNSGCSAIKLKLMEKGIKIPDEMLNPLLQIVRDKSMGRGRSLTDREFFDLVEEVMEYEA